MLVLLRQPESAWGWPIPDFFWASRVRPDFLFADFYLEFVYQTIPFVFFRELYGCILVSCHLHFFSQSKMLSRVPQ